MCPRKFQKVRLRAFLRPVLPMNLNLVYGTASELSLNLESLESVYLHGADLPENLKIDEIEKAVLNALDAPTEFPPFRECVFSGEKLAIPVAPGVPHLEHILRAVLKYFFSSPELHQPEQVTILRTEEDEKASPISLDAVIPDETFRNRIRFQTHRPKKREEMALLGAVAATNETLAISRTLFDAEFVLPIGFFQSKETKGYAGIHTAVYPTFSDAETHKRYADFGPALHASNHDLMHELMHEITEATRQLGILGTLQAIPGISTPGSSRIARFLAGDFRELEKDGNSAYREIWTLLTDRKPEAVLASVTGGDSRSWDCVFHAIIRAANSGLQQNGILAVCSALSGELPRSLQIYRQVQEPELAEKFIRRENLPDAPLAIPAIQAISRFRVFFLSEMEGETLEEINITPIRENAELERLLTHCRSCLILPDAHRIV